MIQDVILILLMGAGAGMLAKRMGQSAAIAQVLVGVVFGPPLLGWFGSADNLEIVGELGVLLLLGMAGMHLGLNRLLDDGWKGFRVAMLGMALCFIGGYSFSIWWGSPGEEALYVGVALTATSIGISVQVLQQFGLVDRDVGRVVISAAVIDDIIALYLLAVAHGTLTDSLQPLHLFGSMVLVAVVFVVIFNLCRWIAGRVLTRTGMDGLSLPISLLLVIGFGWLTEWLGYSLVVGGFFAGLGLGEGMDESRRKALVKQYEGLVLILVPFFFVHIGSQAEWRVLVDDGMTVLVVGLVIIALTGKVAGGYLGAWSRDQFQLPLLIGMSMAPRGEVALVIASIGFQQGHISHHVMIALILVTITAAIAAPAMMAPLARSGAAE